LLKNSLVLLFLFLTACGEFQAKQPPYIDAALEPYVQTYRDYKLDILDIDYIKNIDVFFQILEPYVLGKCIIYGNGDRVILIDPDYWSTMGEADREVVILHEMGHCDLNRGHASAPSIMEAYHIGGYNYLNSKNYYLVELFTLQRNNLLAKMKATETKYKCNHTGGNKHE